MTATTVVRVKDPHDVYIGRPSKWGNKFVIGKDGTREDVVAKYRAWVLTQPDLIADLGELRGLRIACHCAPLACHGDVLARLADSEPVSSDERRPVGWINGFAPNTDAYVFSNFGPGSCIVDGVTYRSGEHGFNAAKTLDLAIREHIGAVPTPREAKRLGSRGGIVTELRPGWDKTVRYEVMDQIVSSKFWPGSSAADTLLAIGDELLLETNTWHDQHWGDCVCDTHKMWPGRNELGKALMRHRAVLREDPADRWVRVMCTGHREKSMDPNQRAWVAAELERLASKLIAEHGMRVAIHGGANGADLAWARAADDAGVDSLWAYLPFPNQTKGWTDQQKADWTHYTSPRPEGAATKRWTLGTDYDVRLLHARNDGMIRDANLVIAVLDPSKTTGGTVSALKKIGTSLPVITLDIVARRVSIALAA